MRTCFLSLLIAFTLGIFSAAQAQTQKVAYVMEDSVVLSLPEYKVQQKVIESYAKQFRTQIETKQKTLQDLYASVLQNRENLAPKVLEQKEKEMQDLQQQVNQLQQQAQEGVARKNQELMGPLFEKVSKAIEAVAKEAGYSIVVPRNMLMAIPNGDDITAKVLQKMGVTK